MRFISPQVYLIAETRIDLDQLNEMIESIGGSIAKNWLDKTESSSQSDGELLTEVSGRICYKSFGVGLNPNVTKIRQNSKDYIQNTLSKGDGSIFEHSSCTFAFLNVSRVFTHELVRHRVGSAISQESLRFVRPTDLGIWLPPELDNNKHKIQSIIEDTEKNYQHLEKMFDWDDMKFDFKKRVTSALRRILPQGMSNSIIWTANHRTLRHVITMRTAESAEIEIRYIFDKVAQILKTKFPLIYDDFESTKLDDDTNSWKPKYLKV